MVNGEQPFAMVAIETNTAASASLFSVANHHDKYWLGTETQYQGLASGCQQRQEKEAEMKLANYVLPAISMAGLATAALAQDEALCPQDGSEAPLALHEEWIMEGWERHEGDPTFVFAEEMAKYYDLESPEGVYWDNFAPGDIQLFTDASVYGANWEDHVNASRSIRHGMTNANHAVVGRDTASSVIGFVGRIEPLDGEVVDFDTRSQLGWACVDGAWKIKHELNYAWIVEPERIEAILGNRLQP